MGYLPLRGKNGEGKFALVDDEDYDYLNQYPWYIDAHGYAFSRFWNKNTKRTEGVGFMHRLLLTNGNKVDHINGNKLDNRRENLRYCTSDQNMYNRRKHSKATSRYKGVFFEKALNKWRACIRFNKKLIYLGSFIDENEAALAYNKKAEELFGEFACLNEVINCEPCKVRELSS
jgi:hypothetical protein